ncbi:MAG: XdhC family protein [Thermomicrobiales bacterium]|nr:XdhC family protein [Thermomicrobiales bacterium]
MSAQVFSATRKAIADSVPVTVVTVVKGPGVGNKLAVLPDRTVGTLGDPALDAFAVPEARRLLDDERSMTEPFSSESGAVELFFESFPPPPTLLIFGAVHVAQALAMFGKQLGFRVVVTDARAKLLTEERFPTADVLIQGWPDEAIAQTTIDRNTYIAILTHDPKFDEPALLGTLATDARYIGAVGSRKTSADRRVRLTEAGATEEQLARIRGPIGLNIGASTPEEMAISILAEIIALRNGRDAQPLTTATGNIRARV